MKAKFVGLLVVATIMAIGLFAEAKIINVPSDYPTIQEGIDAAVDGDTVLVADGTYTGAGNIGLNFLGKAIIVKSVNGAAVTIIDVQNTTDVRGVTFNSGEIASSVLDGFTIKNGSHTYGGGGIGIFYCSPTITNCIITNNTTSNFGGGILCEGGSSTITNCIIAENTAGSVGGGIACVSSSSPTVINCTITVNDAEYGGGLGGLASSSPTVFNTILYFNRASVSGDEIALDVSTIDIHHSDIAGGWEGEGNIDEDPLFVGPDDYHLQAGSPCIDAGTPDGAPPNDLEGNPRDESPDIGAYEFQGDILGAINGTITDQHTGKPIAGAFVIAVQKPIKKSDLTKRDGYFEITDLQPGEWLVIAIKKGYKTGIAKVVVEAGKTTTHDFKLAPK